MPIFLIFFSAMNFFTPSPSNEIIVQIETHDFLASKEYRFGTHSFGLIYRGDLEGILIYCLAATNQPVLRESINIGKKIYLDVNAGAKSKISNRRMAQEVLNKLLYQFDLEIKLSTTVTNKTLKVIRIEQDPVTALGIEKYNSRTSSGGISPTGEENVIIHNSGCYNASYFFTKRKILLSVKDDNQLEQEISFLFPQTLHKKLPKGKRKLMKWMAKYGIQCEIVKEPVRMIVPKE